MADSRPRKDHTSTALTESPLNINYLTHSYVVIVGAPGAHINFDGNKLTRVFGSLGPGNIVQMPPNGLAVMLGEYNQLLLQMPKITFRGATQTILLELYQNARRMVLDPFMSKNATAFGINFELDVEFGGLTPETALNQMLGQRMPHGTQVMQAGLKIKESNISFAKSPRDPDKLLHANFNNHIDKPELSSFDVETLTDRLESFREQNESVLQEIYQCLQKQHA